MRWDNFNQAFEDCYLAQCARDEDKIVIYPHPSKSGASEVMDFLEPGHNEDVDFRLIVGNGTPRSPYGPCIVGKTGLWMAVLNEYRKSEFSGEPITLQILSVEERIARTPFHNGRYKPSGEWLAVGNRGIESKSPGIKEFLALMNSSSMEVQVFLNQLSELRRRSLLTTASIVTYGVPTGVGKYKPVYTTIWLNEGYKPDDLIREVKLSLLLFAQAV